MTMYLIEGDELTELGYRDLPEERRQELLGRVWARAAPVERGGQDFVAHTLRPGDGK